MEREYNREMMGNNGHVETIDEQEKNRKLAMKDMTRQYIEMEQEQKRSGTERIGFEGIICAYELVVVDSIKILHGWLLLEG